MEKQENEKSNIIKSIINEFRQSPIATISVISSTIVGVASLLIAWQQFQISPTDLTLTPNFTGSSLGKSIHIGNVLLVIAFFLSSTFALAVVIRAVSRKHNIAAFFISVPLAALVNFITILIMYLTPPRELSREIFTNAHDLALYASVIIFISICGKAVARKTFVNEDAQKNKGEENTSSTKEASNDNGEFFAELILLVIVLFAWSSFVFKGQVLLTHTFMPEVTHPIETAPNAQKPNK